MEILGYLIVYVICTRLPGVSRESGIVSSTVGGAVEEMMESVVRLIFPNGHFFLTRNMKAKSKLKKNIEDLFEAHGQEIVDFFKKRFPDQLNHSNLKFFDALKPNYNEKDGLEKAFKEAYKTCKPIGRQIDCPDSYKNKKIEEVSEDILGCEWKEIPEPVQKFFRLIERHVYELKYLKMSSENQDFIKIVQQIIKECNQEFRDELLNELRSSFDYIEQVSSMEGKPFREITIKYDKNPFYYYRLECPNCGASGSNVRKEGENNIYCRSCGQTHSFIQAVDDDKIRDQIKEVSQKLSNVVKDGNQECIDELKKLASRTVEVEWLKEFKKETTDELKDISLNVEESTNAILAEIDNCQDLLLQVKNLIVDKDKEEKEILNTISDGINDIKVCCTRIIDMITDIQRLQEILIMLKEYGESSERGIYEKEIACPCCEHKSQFKRFSGEEYYVCPICDFQINKNCVTDQKIEVNVPKIEFTIRDGKIFEKALQGGNAKDVNTLRICITNASIANKLNGLNDQGACQPIERINSNLSPRKIIILGNYFIDFAALKSISCRFGDAKTIVIGESVDMAKRDNKFLMNGWNYDENLHKLNKKIIG